MTGDEREKRRIKAHEYYTQHRELVLEKYKYGIYLRQSEETRKKYYNDNKAKIQLRRRNKNNNIGYTNMLNTPEIEGNAPQPKREKKKPKSSLQRKQDRIIKNLAEVERRAQEFRRKLAEEGIPEYPNPIVENDY